MSNSSVGRSEDFNINTFNLNNTLIGDSPKAKSKSILNKTDFFKNKIKNYEINVENNMNINFDSTKKFIKTKEIKNKFNKSKINKPKVVQKRKINEDLENFKKIMNAPLGLKKIKLYPDDEDKKVIEDFKIPLKNWRRYPINKFLGEKIVEINKEKNYAIVKKIII